MHPCWFHWSMTHLVRLTTKSKLSSADPSLTRVIAQWKCWPLGSFRDSKKRTRVNGKASHYGHSRYLKKDIRALYTSFILIPNLLALSFIRIVNSTKLNWLSVFCCISRQHGILLFLLAFDRSQKSISLLKDFFSYETLEMNLTLWTTYLTPACQWQRKHFIVLAQVVGRQYFCFQTHGLLETTLV